MEFHKHSSLFIPLSSATAFHAFFFTLRIFRILIRIFFQGHWRLTGQQRKRGDHFLFHSTTSTRSRTFRHLFATLHVRWLSHIFNRNACIYQAATRWDLPPYPITIWLIDDVKLVFVCLLDDLIQAFFTAILIQETGGHDCQPCITSEPTNHVFWSPQKFIPVKFLVCFFIKHWVLYTEITSFYSTKAILRCQFFTFCWCCLNCDFKSCNHFKH